MRICFVADLSSIHVQRIISHCVCKKDDILVLSSSPYTLNIPGVTSICLAESRSPQIRDARKEQNGKEGFTGFLKSFIPVSLKLLILAVNTGLCLRRKVGFCIEEIKRFNPEVIYCFRSYPEGMLARHCHIRPLLLRTAGPDISKFSRYPLFRGIIRKALQSADVLVTESVSERNLLQVLCGPRVTPEVIIIGVDPVLFHPIDSRDSLRAKYNLPSDAFVVVSNRSLEGHYNGWLIVEAIQSIMKECPQLVLLYASPSELGRRSKARALAIMESYPRIRFVDHPVPHATVPEILGCGDIYISFSSYDGIPNSLLEAMACGLVPIAADLPQLHEWIEDGITGYLVPQLDTQYLASLVRSLYENREKLADISIRCIEKIRREAVYDDCMDRTRVLLKKLAYGTQR